MKHLVGSTPKYFFINGWIFAECFLFSSKPSWPMLRRVAKAAGFFLSVLQKNPEFSEVKIDLHQSGFLPSPSP